MNTRMLICICINVLITFAPRLKILPARFVFKSIDDESPFMRMNFSSPL